MDLIWVCKVSSRRKHVNMKHHLYSLHDLASCQCIATEIVIEDEEVELTELEMKSEVAKIKRKFEETSAQKNKTAKVTTGGKAGGKIGGKQSSLMSFFKK